MTTTTFDESLTEEQAREALRGVFQQIEESRARIHAIDAQMAQSRIKREKVRQETRETFARIDKILDRI